MKVAKELHESAYLGIDPDKLTIKELKEDKKFAETEIQRILTHLMRKYTYNIQVNSIFLTEYNMGGVMYYEPTINIEVRDA